MSAKTSDQIDEAARQRFESDWMSGQPQPIETYLKDSDSDQWLATLEELIQIDMEFRWRRWSSASLDETVATTEASTVRPAASPPLVETYLEQFPGLSDADILRRLVEAEIELRRATGLPVDRTEFQQRFPDHPLPARWFAGLVAEVLPQQWGAYTLTGRLGQGAMGVVYRAEQTAARREVALKRILTERLTEADATWAEEIVTRFETEAKAAAQLTHENIVPVYDVGEVDGQPYFAMRLVEGKSFSDLVRENTLAPEQAAASMVQVARAIQHAHENGVLHRDVKPANIMQETATGKALITDFGLAKWERTDQTITQSGQLVGTPAYMAPEQARNPHQADERSDVYAIGATLYHLLTGRPPFQASGMVELMRLLLHEEPLAPRKLNSEIPRDLETICLHCLQKEPERRYHSAAKMAEDLQRFLEGRPILARPISTAERSIRWCRRNKTVAAATSLAGLFLITTFLVGWGGYFVTQGKNAQLAELNADLIESNELGTSQIDDYFVVASEDVLLGLPSMQPVRQQLLTMARDYHREFASLRGNDPSARANVAVSELRLGQIDSLLGEPDDGLKQYETALAMIAALPAEDAKQKRVRIAKGDAWNATGTARAYQKKFADAAEAFAKAEQIRQALVEDYPDETAIARKLFNVRMNRGIVAVRTGNLKEAQQLEQGAQQERTDWLTRDNDELLRRDAAIGQYNLAKLALQAGQNEQARNLLLDAIERLSRLIASNSLDVNLRWKRILCRRVLGQVLVAVGELERAQEAFQEILPEVEQIVRENPSVPDYKRQGAEVLIEAGVSVSRLDDAAWVETCRQIAGEWLSTLPAEDARVRYLGATNRCLQGAVLLIQGDGPRALGVYQDALDRLTDLVVDHPENSLYDSKRDEIVKLVIALERALDAAGATKDEQP